jgi:hypothetical protein
MSLKINVLIAAFGGAILIAPPNHANAASACKTAKLLDVQEITEYVPTVQIGQARQDKNGKDWTTVTLPPTRKQTTYVIKLALEGMIYTARSNGDFWGYNPSRMIVNSEVETCVDSKKLVITRPDGKQYKPTIIRRERDESASSSN